MQSSSVPRFGVTPASREGEGPPEPYLFAETRLGGSLALPAIIPPGTDTRRDASRPFREKGFPKQLNNSISFVAEPYLSSAQVTLISSPYFHQQP